jgi:hypothetical protein
VSAGGPSPAVDVQGLLEAVREAGAGTSDVKAALRARQARAAEPDVVGALAVLADGSPTAQRLRAGLRELGVTTRALDAGVRWWRGQRGVPQAAEADERPTIQITEDLHIDVAAAVQALEADPDLYARSGSLVRVVNGDAGEPLIAPHTAATLRVRLVMFARWTKTNEAGDVVACLPSDAITLAVLEARAWSGIRILSGIVETPTLRPDRTISQRPGYDAATRTLYLPTVAFPEIPDQPTHIDACEALRFFWVETSYDFPFRGMGYADPAALASDPDGVWRFKEAKKSPDAWGITAASMTIVARPGLVGDVPAVLFDAAAPGTGKGLQVDVSVLATVGRIPEKLTWPNQGDKGSTDAEVGKMLAGAVIEGAQIIVWDEILGPFGGPAINNVLTCRGRTKLRIIGTPNTPTLSYTATMLGAGNNITARDNTHRRALVPRLESPDENPADHGGWRCEDLRANVAALRPRLVVALLTVLRAYVVAGCPAEYERDGVLLPMPPKWGGGFEDWSGLVARAILWAGGGDVMGCRPTSDPEARNEERDAIAAVLDAVSKLEPKKTGTNDPTGAGMTIKSLVDALYTREQIRGEAPADAYGDAREAIEALTETPPGRKPQSKKLGDRLHLWKRRPVDGRMLEMAAKDRTNARRWTVRTLGKPKPTT